MTNQERISKIVPKWASDAIMLGMMVQTNPQIAYIVQQLAEADKWTMKLSAATQKKPDEMSTFIADNFNVTIPPYEISDFVLRTKEKIQQVEKFNWVAEKLYNCYLSEGELRKKGDSLLLAPKEYVPIDWIKLTKELEKVVKDDT